MDPDPTRRQILHQILLDILGTDNVYFQPPPNISMTFPCIRYERDRSKTLFATNFPYLFHKKYQVTYISRTPEDVVFDKLAALPKCVHDRFYTAEGLNHDVFTLFF